MNLERAHLNHAANLQEIQEIYQLILLIQYPLSK